MIRLFVVDGNRVFAEALAARLDAEPDIQVLRCATDHHALGAALHQSAAQVVVADAALYAAYTARRADDGPEVPAPREPSGASIRRIGHPVPGPRSAADGPAVILVAEERDAAVLVPSVRAGVRGWVSRRAGIEELLAAIRAVADGGTSIPAAALSRVLQELVWAPPEADEPRSPLDALTRREREVLGCLAEGLDRSGVAARLRMSKNTVRTHVQSILSKLGVSSSLAAVAMTRSHVGRPAMEPVR